MGRKGKEAAAKAGVADTTTAAAQLRELSLTTTTTFKPNDAADPFDLLDMCVAALQDKRGPTREHAMAALCGALEALPPLDELDSRCLTVFALCGVSIKKAATNPKEARLAYRTVGLLALTLRAGAPDLLAHAFPLLSKTLRVQAAHDDAPTLVAALDCLAAVTFAGALDAEDVDRSMKAYVPKKDMEVVVATVRDLAIEAGGQGVSKTMLPEQRHLFRQVVAFLDHDERPTVTVTVRASTGRRNHVLKVSTWAKVVQLNFIRSFLGGGFLKHVQDNELFKEVFSFDVEVGKRLSIAKRKEMDKNRDKSMNVRRDLRWECKHVLCLESRSPDKVLQLGWH
ncbi:hypothetical protein QOZ80_2BG0159900 [Eleusine coracana subsp. coracana]|nr:hypothetical protein QOZ80_2BG0159900 [Eleusine coracana subsp. coracana]